MKWRRQKRRNTLIIFIFILFIAIAFISGSYFSLHNRTVCKFLLANRSNMFVGIVTGIISGFIVTKIVSDRQEVIDRERTFHDYQQRYVYYLTSLELELELALKNETVDSVRRVINEDIRFDGFSEMTDEAGAAVLREARKLLNDIESESLQKNPKSGLLNCDKTTKLIKRLRKIRMTRILSMKYVPAQKFSGFRKWAKKPTNELLIAYKQLNKEGKEEAEIQVKKLAKDPNYQKKKLVEQNANKENDD